MKLLSACAAPSKRAAQRPIDLSALSARAPEPPAQDPQNQKQFTETTVRVLLAEKAKSAYIKHSGKVYIYTQNLDKKYKISTAGTLAVKTLGNGKIQIGTLQAAQPIILEPALCWVGITTVIRAKFTLSQRKTRFTWWSTLRWKRISMGFCLMK